MIRPFKRTFPQETIDTSAISKTSLESNGSSPVIATRKSRRSAAGIAHIDSLSGLPRERVHVAGRSARVWEILKDWRFRIDESRETEGNATTPIGSSRYLIEATSWVEKAFYG